MATYKSWIPRHPLEKDGKSESDIQARCPVSECYLAIDVKLKSADGEVFGAHQTNLEVFSDAFPTAGSTTAEEVVTLEENAGVLRLMLQFMHNTRQPNISKIPFSTLAPLAEAVEKYMIYSAMQICHTHMEQAVEEHPIEVFVYSLKHNHPDLANKSAKLTLSKPTEDFYRYAREVSLDDSSLLRWYRYRERWTDILLRVVLKEPRCPQLHKGGLESCDLWPLFQFKVIMDIGNNLSALEDIYTIQQDRMDILSPCKHCSRRCLLWVEQIDGAVRDLGEFFQ